MRTLFAIYTVLFVLMWPMLVVMRGYVLLRMLRGQTFAKRTFIPFCRPGTFVTSTDNPIAYWSGIGVSSIIIVMLSLVYIYLLPVFLRFLMHFLGGSN